MRRFTALVFALGIGAVACKREPPPPSPALVERTPAATPVVRTATRATELGTTYDVVFVAADDVLNVRVAADPAASLRQALAYDARGVRGTGNVVAADSGRWASVYTPQGLGWANAAFLTPATSTAAFAADARLPAFLETLHAVLRAKGDLRPLVGPRGLYVFDYGTERRFAPEALARLLASTTKTKWNGPACGEDCKDGTFSEVVGQPLMEVLAHPKRETARDRVLKGGNASAQPPAKLTNLRFVAVMDAGTDAADHLDWRSFLLYVEPVDGALKLVAIVPDQWSP